MSDKNTAFRNGQADYFGAQFNAGELRLLSAGDVLLATVSLQNPAFGAAAAGVITAAGLPLAFVGLAAAGAGTVIAKATLISADETQSITELSVGNANANVVLDNTNIAEGQTGSMSSFTITIPATIVDPAA